MNVQTVFAQKNYHEIGLMVGLVSLRGDYGLRGDMETIRENTGLGIGINHYINFGYKDFISRYFRQHFKVRNTLLYHSSNLKHYGVLAERQSESGLKLRAMYGEANVLEIGSGLEYYFMRIRDFGRGRISGAFSPFAGAGINFVSYSPSADTNLPGRLGSPQNTYRTFLADPGEEPAFTNASGVTASINLQLGAKYQIKQNSNLMLELRWHYYFSDFVDGLKPIGDQNRYNDWMFWLSFGYTYYLY
jgi:hypothetical protein